MLKLVIAPRYSRQGAGVFSACWFGACLLATSVQAATPALSEAQQAAEAYVQATVHFDADALPGLLAPTYQEISPVGDVDPRARVLGFYPAEQHGKTPDVTAELTDWQVQEPSAGIAVTSAKLTYRSLKDGSEYPLRVQFVLQKIQGHWRLLSSQYTPIRPKKAKS